MRALVLLALVLVLFVSAAPARAAVQWRELDAGSVASHGGDADAATRWALWDPLEQLAALLNTVGLTRSAQSAASADVDRSAMLAAEDVPAELLLAAALVLVLGAALAAAIGWRLCRP